MGIMVRAVGVSRDIKSNAPMPTWIIFLCYGTLAAGTLFGGFRIVRTMGMKLTKLDPMHGFCAEAGGGVTILAVSALGIPVSRRIRSPARFIGVGNDQRTQRPYAGWWRPNYLGLDLHHSGFRP